MKTSKLQEQIIQILKDNEECTMYSRRIFEILLNNFDYPNKRVLSASLSRTLKTLEKQGRIKLVRHEWNDQEDNIRRKQNNYYGEKYDEIKLLNVNCGDSPQLTNKIIKVNCPGAEQLTVRGKK